MSHTLYNIHTHHIPPDTEGDSIKYILNIYPHELEMKNHEITPNGKFSCSIHPWYLNDYKSAFATLQKIASDEQIVAIGECGLDKMCGTDFSTQMRIFSLQIELAQHLNKPLIVHCVKAWDELFALHKKYKPTNKWIVHGFRGNAHLAKQLVDRDIYISIGANYNIDALKQIPYSSVFCETDDSNLPIGQVYRAISDDLKISYDFLSGNVANNCRLVFPNL